MTRNPEKKETILSVVKSELSPGKTKCSFLKRKSFSEHMLMRLCFKNDMENKIMEIKQ